MDNKLPLTAVIFAGGKSSRMGRDKSLLPFGGYDTLSEYQYRRLVQLFEKVHISTKADKFGFDAPLIYDRYEESSPLVGLVSILESIEEEECFILSVDAPFVDIGVIETLYYAGIGQPHDAVIAKSPEGMEPLCGIYRKSLLGKAREFLAEENHRLGHLLKSVDTRFVSFHSSGPFDNLNHPHEYEDALERTRRGS